LEEVCIWYDFHRYVSKMSNFHDLHVLLREEFRETEIRLDPFISKTRASLKLRSEAFPVHVRRAEEAAFAEINNNNSIYLVRPPRGGWPHPSAGLRLAAYQPDPYGFAQIRLYEDSVDFRMLTEEDGKRITLASAPTEIHRNSSTKATQRSALQRFRFGNATFAGSGAA
jgi:hypothetical protein